MARNDMEIFAEEIYQKALDEHSGLWEGATLDESEYIFDAVVNYYEDEIKKHAKTKKQRDSFATHLFEHISAGLS